MEPPTTDHDRVLAELPDVPDLLGQHPQLLKVDEAIDLGLVAVKEEGEVLLDDGEEGDEGRMGRPLQLPVLGHVVEWIHVAHQVLLEEEGESGVRNRGKWDGGEICH